LSMVFVWLKSRLFHCSLVVLYNVHELDGFGFGGFEGENKFCNLETLCCDFDETIVVFFFIMVCYISFWLCMHVCMSCEEFGCYGKPNVRSLFWVFKHIVLPPMSPPIVLFTRPYIVGLGISFVHLLGDLL
jgi:hypothetical protein